MAFTTTGIMALGGAAGGAGSLAGAYSEAAATRAQAAYKASQARQAARAADLQAEGAVSRGAGEAARLLSEGQRLAARQRVAGAGAGLGVFEGAPADIQRETAALSAADAQQIRVNATREAFGFRAQAAQLRSQARLAQRGGRLEARQSLVAGGAAAARAGLGVAAEYSKDPFLLESQRASEKARRLEAARLRRDVSRLPIVGGGFR